MIWYTKPFWTKPPTFWRISRNGNIGWWFSMGIVWGKRKYNSLNLSSWIKLYKYFELRIYPCSRARVCYSKATGVQQSGTTVLNTDATFPSTSANKHVCLEVWPNKCCELNRTQGSLFYSTFRRLLKSCIYKKLFCICCDMKNQQRWRDKNSVFELQCRSPPGVSEQERQTVKL